VADFGIWGIIDYISKNTYYIHIQKILLFTLESGR